MSTFQYIVLCMLGFCCGALFGISMRLVDILHAIQALHP